jgi:large subunit ribosomal protein L25
MTAISLKAEKRTVTGRKVKNLRRDGLLPANIYGKNEASQSLQLNVKDFEKTYKQAGETGLVELSIGGDVKHVLISNIHVNPVTDQFLHVDFRQVSLKEKVVANVPVEIVGEAQAEKDGIGTLVVQLNEVEVEALPLDLPESFNVDVSTLVEVDQAIYVKDLKYDKAKVEIKDDLEAIVAKIEPPQKEEVVEAPVVEEGAEGEVTPTPEGEAPSTEESTEADAQAQE